MKDGGHRGWVTVLKLLLCCAFAAVAVFFVLQASLGARNADVAGSSHPAAETACRPLGSSIYRYLEDLLRKLSRLRVYRLVPFWELAVSGEVYAAAEEGCLYITSTPGQVMAVDAASGGILWSLDLGVWISAPPEVEAGIVYVGATNHVLYALDAASGALLWYYTSQGEILARPVASGGTVFFTADNDSIYDLIHRLYALDARSGELLWTYDTESWTPSPPAVGTDAVYLGGYRREVYALDKHTGRELWSFKASNIVFSSPQVASGRVFFTCIDGHTEALDAANGTPEWSAKLPGFVWLTLPDASGNLYACYHRNTVAALAMDSGETRWEFADGDFLTCASLSSGEELCAFSAQGKAYILDASSGELLGLLLAPHAFASPPLVAGGFIFAGSPDGTMRAYALPGGRLP